MTKVLVTGASGYIGNILCEQLLSKNLDVIAVDNFMYGQSTTGLNLCSYPNYEIFDVDVRDEQVMKDHYQKADVIIPLAAIVGAPASKKAIKTTEEINYEVIRAMCKFLSKDQLVLFPVTNSGYGISKGQDMCTEESELNPISHYARTKVEAEKIILQEVNNKATFRLATVFGLSNRMRLDLLVNDFTYKALSDRYIVLFEHNFRRNYIHVKDVSNVFVFAIENPDLVNNNIFNVGLSNANLTKYELCEKIKEHIPELTIIKSEIGTDPDKRDYIVSNKKIESLGWAPKYTLSDGIKELKKAFCILNKSSFNNV